jgi:hypothetical protein
MSLGILILAIMTTKLLKTMRLTEDAKLFNRFLLSFFPPFEGQNIKIIGRNAKISKFRY